MNTITINLTDEKWRRLKEMAARLGIAPEELIQTTLNDLLTQPDESFKPALDYVLEKNKELYRKLA